MVFKTKKKVIFKVFATFRLDIRINLPILLMSKPINVYSIPELRQTLDEALPGVLTKLDYQQSFSLIDGKLAIGYSIAVVAGMSFLLDKKFAYKDVVFYQIALVGAYALLSIAFWYYTRYVENEVKYVGTDKKGNKLYIKTCFEDGVPDYKVELKTSTGKEINTVLPAYKVFNEAGYLQNNLFYQWFAEQIQLLNSKKCQ